MATAIVMMIVGAALNATAFTGGMYLVNTLTSKKDDVDEEQIRHDKALEKYKQDMGDFEKKRQQYQDWLTERYENKKLAEDNLHDTDYAFTLYKEGRTDINDDDDDDDYYDADDGTQRPINREHKFHAYRGGINFDWGGMAYDVFIKEIGGPVHHYDDPIVEHALTKALGGVALNEPPRRSSTLKSEPTDSTDVIKNILDEPIPEGMKKRLLKPLLPGKFKSRPIPTPRKKRKAILEEFDPHHPSKKLRTTTDYQKEMEVPQGHPLGSDPKAFLEGVQLSKLGPDGVEELTDPVLRHKQEVLLQSDEIKEGLNKAIPHILELLEKWTQRGSGWVVDRVETLWLDIAKYQPLRGGSFIPLPAAVKNKKAVVNVKNKDDHCLRWTLRSALFPATHHVDRSGQYQTQDGLNFEGVDAPTPISQIPRVEKQNNLAINVFGWDKGVIVHHLSKQPEDMPRINVLLIEKAGKFHYTWIKNISRLLYDQSKHRERKYFCERCLHGYSREDLLEAHRPECRGIGQTAVRVEMPEEGKNKLTFQNYHKQMPAPYIIYADFEALTTKVEGPELDPTKSNTQKTQHHYCYVVVRCDGRSDPPVEYRGPNAAEHFLRAIQKEEKKIKVVLANPQTMRMTREDWWTHNTASHCHVCEKQLDVVFHNLRGYDSHLLMQAISKVDGLLSCIPNNTEKYISFGLNQLRFIDSAQFLLASLDKLVAVNQPEVFQITAKYEPVEERRKLLLRKGVYPYEYMASWERFAEPKLPPKEAFYSKLSDEHISPEDYEHAQRVWKAFDCTTMGDYHDLYNRTDVLLLADVFETFRKTCQMQYGLDPAHYYTSPGLSWDALLKKTGVELELLTDYDQHLFIEKGLRGGISMVSRRYAEANNPMVEGLDANNLYGWAMSQPLPVRDFRWVEDCEQLAGTIVEHRTDDPEGYILEVDLEYPEELHDTHNAYPLAPERMVVPKEWMSEYQHNLLGVGVAPTEVEKLVSNLRNKERYVLHYRNLQLYLSLGMRLTKIHRALRFQQSPWMEPYIRLNTELRKVASSGFEKDLYKLMNNSVFGKTMENLRKRVSVNLVRASEEDKLRRLIASPAFARANIFDDDLAAIQVHKSRLVLNRPVYVGMSILDLSKHLMYDFYYNRMKAQYGERCQLL
ncbi:hypothetical protein QZH41_004240 [Actinostola sp. cb2023]|nr:hypothetical protein QZH41_004240 [Actinostola sp. cb2023]